MTAFVLGLIGVPLLDHAVKLLVRARLRHRSLSLGPVGAIRVTPAPIWLMRGGGRWTPGAMWLLWILAAGALVIVCRHVPSLALPFGLVLGGSLSHAVEISVRGFISDYIRLRFWPSFDLADVALTVGAVTIVLEIAAMSGAWR